MIETLENGAQLAAVTVCFVLALRRRARDRAYEVLALFYSAYLLGDLYWQAHLFFYGQSPEVFYVSDVSWCAAWLFLFCLLRRVSTAEERRFRHPLLLAPPAFCAAMCVLYAQWGSYLSNIVCALVMSLILIYVARGLLYLRGGAAPRRALYRATFFFCACEYAAWTASCFFGGDSLANPYYWCDALLTVSAVLLLPAAGKAVDA